MDRFFAKDLTTFPHFKYLQLRIHFNYISPNILHLAKDIMDYITENLPLCHQNGLVKVLFVV